MLRVFLVAAFSIVLTRYLIVTEQPGWIQNVNSIDPKTYLDNLILKKPKNVFNGTFELLYLINVPFWDFEERKIIRETWLKTATNTG